MTIQVRETVWLVIVKIPSSTLLMNSLPLCHFEDTNPENGVMSKAAKRQKTVQNGQFATPAPQSNYGFDTSFPTGATYEDTFWPVGNKGQ